MRTAGVNVDSVWLDSDHSPFLHMPERVAQILQDAAVQT